MKSSVLRMVGLFASVLVAGAAGAQSTQAVEWKVSEGGNGHWYQLREFNSLYWTVQKQACEAVGGHLVCFEDGLAEINFVEALIPPGTAFLFGPSIGLTQLPNSAEPASGWVWVTGVPLDTTQSRWFPGEPNNGPGYQEDRARYRRDQPSGSLGWNDVADWVPSGDPISTQALVEWSADCNGDGIVDFGQIKSGQLADDNANGVPDICELSVTGVVPPSVPSQGGSAITIKGNNFPENPVVLVGGLPANDVVRVSATRITAATPSLLPGMASVKVNDFTLEEALYIRPQCGSDLDQDGEVTTADIAIVLLDFGPCYVTATSPQPDDSKPFMLQEQPAPEAPQSR